MSRDVVGTGRTCKGEVPRGSDMAENALPLGTVLSKVTVGSTLKATPVIEDPRVVKSSLRRGGLRGCAIGDRGRLKDRVWLRLD